jgi:hypothetical protein
MSPRNSDYLGEGIAGPVLFAPKALTETISLGFVLWTKQSANTLKDKRLVSGMHGKCANAFANF